MVEIFSMLLFMSHSRTVDSPITIRLILNLLWQLVGDRLPVFEYYLKPEIRETNSTDRRIFSDPYLLVYIGTTVFGNRFMHTIGELIRLNEVCSNIFIKIRAIHIIRY